MNETTKVEKCDEWAFFRTKSGQIKYNEKCKNCVHGCRQSHKADVVFCRNYIDRHTATEEQKANALKPMFPTGQ